MSRQGEYMARLLASQTYTAREMYQAIKQGDVPGYSIVDKFGRGNINSSTPLVVSQSTVYQTPTTLTSLECYGTATDTAGGAGARTVRWYGIGTDWQHITEDVTMNGVTPVALTKQFYRVYRGRVLTSGTYASGSGLSHSGGIFLRVAGGGAAWSQISAITTGYGLGSTEIAAYTSSVDQTMYLFNVRATIESNKTATVYLFIREGADTVSAPYTPASVRHTYVGLVQGTHHLSNGSFIGPFTGPTDVGFLATTAAAASISIDFDILLTDNTIVQ